MTDSGFHIYFWKLLVFWRTLYKVDISIKQTLLSCTSGVHFIEIPLWVLKRQVEFNQRSWANVLFECPKNNFVRKIKKIYLHHLMNMSRLLKKPRNKREHLSDLLVIKWMKKLLLTISSFTSMPFCHIVFLHCLRFYILSHFLIIRCIVRPLITISMHFFIEYNWKKKTWKVFFGCQNWRAQTSITVSQTTWICYQSYLLYTGVSALRFCCCSN